MTDKQLLNASREISLSLKDIADWIIDYSNMIAVEPKLKGMAWAYLYCKYMIPTDGNRSAFYIILNTNSVRNLEREITPDELVIGVLNFEELTYLRTKITALWYENYTYVIEIIFKELLVNFHYEPEFSSFFITKTETDDIPERMYLQDNKGLQVKTTKRKTRQNFGEIRQRRANLFKEILDKYPDFTYEQVAVEATDLMMEQYEKELREHYPTWDQKTILLKSEERFRTEWKKPNGQFSSTDVSNDFYLMGWTRKTYRPRE